MIIIITISFLLSILRVKRYNSFAFSRSSSGVRGNVGARARRSFEESFRSGSGGDKQLSVSSGCWSYCTPVVPSIPVFPRHAGCNPCATTSPDECSRTKKNEELGPRVEMDTCPGLLVSQTGIEERRLYICNSIVSRATAYYMNARIPRSSLLVSQTVCGKLTTQRSVSRSSFSL